MRTVYEFPLVILITAASVGPVAAFEVKLTSSLGAEVLEQRYTAGEVVQVPLFAATEGPDGVFGVELNVSVAIGKARIRSVAFEPEFAREVGNNDQRPPADEFKASRSQPPESLDRALGAKGNYVKVCTIEVEMLSDLPFAEALQISARVALIGHAPESVEVLGIKSTGSAPATGEIAIYSGKPVPEDGKFDPATANIIDWTTATSAITLQVYAQGGSAPAETLTAGKSYELRYSSPHNVDGYAVTAFGPSATAISSVQEAGNGAWSATDSFTAEMGAQFAAEAEAVDGGTAPAGLTPAALIMDIRDKDAASATSGTLFRFTPTSPGTLKFDGIFWDIDEQQVNETNMAATLTLEVQSPG